MTDPKRDEVRSWLFKARQDLDAAAWLLASPTALYGVRDFDVLRYAATMLTPFAVTTRYPGEIPDISAKDAKDALDQANLIWNFVIARLPEDTHIP